MYKGLKYNLYYVLLLLFHNIICAVYEEMYKPTPE